MMEEKESKSTRDVWASGEAYEPYVGRWSRIVAEAFLDWLEIPPGSLWLDIGSGTGALTQAILELASPQAVIGIDSADGYIDYASQRITDSRAVFQQGDAQALPATTGHYDAVVSGLALNFIPNQEQAIREMSRTARPGGLVAAYVWDYAGRMQFMRHFWNAAAALDPAAAEMDEGRRFPICQPGPLSSLFSGAGLTQVEVRPIDSWTTFKDFEDYWTPFLGGQGPAPSYVMSLSEQARVALRERLRSTLPFALDGSIPMVARAWAVRGLRE
jgi:SAM-dependent methyltransferase